MLFNDKMIFGMANINGLKGTVSGDAAALPALMQNVSPAEQLAIQARMETPELNLQFSVSGTAGAVRNLLGDVMSGAHSVAHKLIRKTSSPSRAASNTMQGVLNLVREGLRSLRKPKKVQHKIEEIVEEDSGSSAGDSSVGAVDLGDQIAKINSADELRSLASRVQARILEIEDATGLIESSDPAGDGA